MFYVRVTYVAHFAVYTDNFLTMLVLFVSDILCFSYSRFCLIFALFTKNVQASQYDLNILTLNHYIWYKWKYSKVQVFIPLN